MLLYHRRLELWFFNIVYYLKKEEISKTYCVDFDFTLLFNEKILLQLISVFYQFSNLICKGKIKAS